MFGLVARVHPDLRHILLTVNWLKHAHLMLDFIFLSRLSLTHTSLRDRYVIGLADFSRYIKMITLFNTARSARSAIALSLSLPLGRGTAFRSRLRHQRPFRFSGSIWKQFYLLAHSRRSNTFLRVILSILSPCFILQFYVFCCCVF